jgi:hypothetical protein
MESQTFAPAVVAEEVEVSTLPETTKQTDLMEANSRAGVEASNFLTTTNLSSIVEVAAADSTMAGMDRKFFRLFLSIFR